MEILCFIVLLINSKEKGIIFNETDLNTSVIIPKNEISHQVIILRAKFCNDSFMGIPMVPFKKRQRKHAKTRLRTIGEVVNKVLIWRELRNGIVDDTGKYIKMTLREAAEIVDVPKKTLDDYYLQIKDGCRYGFDFEANRNNTISCLRKYVKEHTLSPRKYIRKHKKNN